MAQSWLADHTPLPPIQPERPKRGVWFWIKETVLFPFRLAGLIRVVALTLGGIGMWVIPDLAERHKVDMVLLVLRALDDETPARPFHRLNYQEKIDEGLLDLRPEETSKPRRGEPKPRDAVVSVHTSREPDRSFVYTVRHASGKTRKHKPITPHTIVPADELADAREDVRRLFPTTDRQRWSAVLAWGESLFVTSWVRQYDPDIAPTDRFPGPPGGTEDEHLWCVWQVLRSGGAPEEDLFRLPELFAATFPAEEDRTTALAWANTLYERMGVFYRARQRYYTISKDSKSGREAELAAYASLRQVLPPDQEWTRLWLLQQYVGLTPAAREAARQRWLGYFPAIRHEQVLSLGAALAEERREKGEALPNVPDVLPALCVVERITGTDGDGQACCAALARLPELKLMSGAVQFAYPNDDLFYLLAAGDPLRIFPLGDIPRGEPVYYLAVGIFILVIIGLTSLGVQTALQWFAARLVLRKSTRPLWKKHMEGRGEEPWWLSALGVLLLAGVGCLTAPYSISELIGVQIGSPVQLFLGALEATALGGVLIATFRRIGALFLVACGVDIEETWADEVLGIVLGALALYHFGNDFLAIALFALSDFLPGLLFIGIRRLRGHRPAPSLAPPAATRQPAAPARMPGIHSVRI